jgi:hypothetical protein
VFTESQSSPRGRGTKQETIREAAQRLFLAHGFAGTTTDEIAVAGVAKEMLDRPGNSPLDVFAAAEPACADIGAIPER